MKKIHVLFVILICFSVISNVNAADTGPSPKDTQDAIKIPENLGECFDALENWLSPENMEVFKNTKEEELAVYHFSIGLSMRNSWGLWGGSALQEFFHKIGIYHPDDMSGIIITAFNRHLNGRPINLKELTQHYLKYWQEQGSDTAVPAPDSVIAMAEETANEKSIASPKDEEEILADLESADPLVRMKAVSLIGRGVKNIESGRLAKLLRDEDAGVRIEAVYAIDRLGGAYATQLIISALNDENLLVRKNAVSILYRSQDTGALASMYDSSDRNMRLNIVKILSGKNDSESLGVVIKALKDEDQEVRETSSSGIEGSSLGLKLYFKPEEFIDKLKDDNPDVRRYFAERLGKRKVKKALDSIIELLDDENDDVVLAAINALGDMEDARAIEPLEQFIADPGKARFADEARMAVDIIREDKTFRDLLKIMLTGSKNERRNAVLYSLRDYDDPRAVSLLIDALKDEDYWIREYAIGTLGEKRDKRAVEPLLSIVETHGETSRMPTTLGELGDPRAIPCLKKYLDDGYMHNRREAAKALYNLKWRPSSKDEKVMFYFGMGSYEMLSNVGEPAVDYLLTQLKDGGMRKDAVIALGKTGSARAVAPLVALLPDIAYCKFAAGSLEELGWKPGNEIEKIWLWVGKADKKNLKEHWSEARDVLAEEVQGTDIKRAEFAVYTLVGVNDPTSLDMLRDIFSGHGNKSLAELYVRSGNEVLIKTAQEWAAKDGISIECEADGRASFFYRYVQIF